MYFIMQLHEYMVLSELTKKISETCLNQKKKGHYLTNKKKKFDKTINMSIIQLIFNRFNNLYKK